MAYSEYLKSNGNRAHPCFRQFWIGKLSDKYFPIQILQYISFKHILLNLINRLCDLVVTVPGYRTIPNFLRSSGSGRGSTQPRDYNWGATWKKSNCSGLEIREYGRRDPSRWPQGTLYPQILALTLPTRGGRSLVDSGHGLCLLFD
jgi:hypothetical protein